ncbi:hypothetical protein [Zhihengliuella sp.]|uniref:hypothetical protein n=1 Tax=Zhihengliuella sp. TaxID=1954483 RepID=UPI002810BB58|nr:hypothetical protein [Zhihengliuella sp.]
MPVSVQQLFAAAGLERQGVVRWGEPVPTNQPGVYCVSTSEDPEGQRLTPFLPSAARLAGLLEACPRLSVDGEPANVATLAHRLSRFWLDAEPVLYVGQTGSSLRLRVGQYYGTPMGASRPHAGGWWLKSIANLDALYLHFAPSEDPVRAEREMLKSFASHVTDDDAASLFDQERIAPFANVRVASGELKHHGLLHYAAEPADESTSTPVVVWSQPVTDKDRLRSNLRIPSASKYVFPEEPGMVTLVIDGEERRVQWRPNGTRSGTLGVGKKVMATLLERGERIRIEVRGGVFALFRK